MRKFVTAVTWILLALPADAWNAHGHRLISRAALRGLPAEAPAWLRDESFIEKVAWMSNQADRWRGWPMPTLGHENKPDHYLDIDDLAQFGLTLETIPKLRNEYLRTLCIAKHVHPEKIGPYDAAKDPENNSEWPGFVLHAIAEHYVKLQAAFHEIRILEKLDDPARAFQMEQARANAAYHMGFLSHFVGDMAQPLHSTKHHNGWDGDNPAGYTKSNRFHSYIDGGVLARHSIRDEDLAAVSRVETRVSPRDPWDDVLKYVRATHECVEPLYKLEKSGDLDREPGKVFILERLARGGEMLSALIWAAWSSSAPNEKQLADFRFYESGETGRPAASAPETQPAP
jgi:S1/P1 Nuclease